MNDPVQYSNAVARLRTALASLKGGALAEIANQKKISVLQFGAMFTKDHIAVLTQEEFLSFIKFENDRHWRGARLFGGGHPAAADVARLRKGLSVLLDEDNPLEQRFSEAIAAVPGLGQSVASAVLSIANPDRYSAWYGDLEVAIRAIDLWPEFKRGTSVGARYQAVNSVLLGLATDLQIDLWALDSLLPLVGPDETEEELGPDGPGQTLKPIGLESHLQQFLVANWDQLELGKDWTIKPGDANAETLGAEIPTSTGKSTGSIDILAKHRHEPRWLVVELKRGLTSDNTLGQVLRYMGCVKKELAEPSDTVEGLIIAHDADDKLLAALSVTPNVRMMVYRISFSLADIAG